MFSLQLLSLGRSSVVSNVIVLINVDDYGIGYNLTSSDVVSGAAVEGQTLVRANQLAGIRPVIADCNVALGLSVSCSAARCYSLRLLGVGNNSDVVVSLLVSTGEGDDSTLGQIAVRGLLGLKGLQALRGDQVEVNNGVSAVRLGALVSLLNNAVQSIGAAQAGGARSMYAATTLSSSASRTELPEPVIDL